MNALLPLPLILCCLVLVQSQGAVATARTPTPTSTPSPVATATPVAPQPAVFNIFPWINARPVAHSAIAKIGETTCAIGLPGPGTTRLWFQLSVPASESVPGCGYEGAMVTFFLDGQQAPQTAVWHSGAAPQTLDVIIGPPFARIQGILYTSMRLATEPIVPYIGSQACGEVAPLRWIGLGPDYSYGTVVYSAEQQAGCGVEGSPVTFKLLDAQGNVIAVASEKGVWHAWDGVSDVQHLDLTFGPAIAMPGTGTGDAPGGVWQTLPAVLALLGIAGVGIALTLGRRTA